MTLKLNFEAKAKNFKPRPECLEAETEAKNHKTKAEAKILVSRPICMVSVP